MVENVHVRERPILILFNKCDVHLNGEADEICEYKSKFVAEQNGDEHNGEMALISTSGKEGTHVERSIRWMVDAITKQKQRASSHQ